MNIKSIKDIPQNSSGSLTEGELKVVVACKWLEHGYNSILGGDKLSAWLNGHMSEIEEVFGCDDRVYIRTKTKELNVELAQFVLKENIGDEVEWKKCKDSDHWWLYIWWD